MAIIKGGPFSSDVVSVSGTTYKGRYLSELNPLCRMKARTRATEVKHFLFVFLFCCYCIRKKDSDVRTIRVSQ